MIDTIPQPEASLPEFLAARARHSDDGTLVADVIGGLALLGLASYWHGRFWYLAAAFGACVFAFGAWGVADRELGERATAVVAPTRAARTVVHTLAALRVAAALAGALAAIFLLLALLGVALGRMIS